MSVDLGQPAMVGEVGKSGKRLGKCFNPKPRSGRPTCCVPRFTTLWKENFLASKLASWMCCAPGQTSWVIGGYHKERKGVR